MYFIKKSTIFFSIKKIIKNFKLLKNQTDQRENGLINRHSVFKILN